VNVFILFDPHLPSWWWLLTSLHLVVHLLYHAQHPYGQPFIAFVASSCSALICLSWICHFDWQEQIAAVATNAVEPDAESEV